LAGSKWLGPLDRCQDVASGSIEKAAHWIAFSIDLAPGAALLHFSIGITLRRHAPHRSTCVQTACRCHGVGCQAVMRSNTQALVKGRIARFLDSLLRKDRGYDRC
jgi:hypothetical protein